MKKLLVTISFLIPFFSFTQDTTIHGVSVNFHYTPEIFPNLWRTSPINATGEEISAYEIQRTKKIMLTALKKYPVETLQQNLAGGIFWLRSMKFFEVVYGGTNSTNALYLTDNGEAMGYTNSYIEQTFHHEFSSILMRNYAALLDTIAWKEVNARGFRYNDPEHGVGAIRNHQSSQTLDTAICRNGILTEYGMSSLENDANTFAQNLFCPANNFWMIVDRYPLVRRKTLLLIAFYHRLNTVFTEDYFRKLALKN